MEARTAAEALAAAAPPAEPHAEPDNAAVAAVPAELWSAADCEAYLQTLPGGNLALEQAAGVTTNLNARPDELHQEELTYLLQAWHSSISTQLHAALAGENAPEAAADCWPHIELAVESCLAAAVRRRVTDTLWREHAATDRLLLETAAGLADGSAQLLPRSASMQEDAQVAAGESLPGHSPAAAAEGSSLPAEVLATCGVALPLRRMDFAAPAAAISRLEAVSCPLEGINCLQAVTDALVAEADECHAAAGGSDGPVSSDDLLPLLIATLIKAKLPHLYSCLQYLAAFHSSGDWNGRAGFQLATLEAAITFLQQQASQQGGGSGGGSASDDADDAAPASGSREDRMECQSTGRSALLAFLDSDAPLTFMQSSPSRPAGRQQRHSGQSLRAPRSLLPPHGPAAFGSWGSASGTAPPSGRLLPCAAFADLLEADLEGCLPPCSWRHDLPRSFASGPTLAHVAALSATSTSADSLTAAATAVLTAAATKASCSSSSSSEALGLAKQQPEAMLLPSSPPSTPLTPAAQRIQQRGCSGELSPPSAGIRHVSFAVPAAGGAGAFSEPKAATYAAAVATTPSHWSQPAPAAVLCFDAEASTAGVGIGILLSPQPLLAPSSRGSIIPAARRCVSEPRPAARPRPIPRRLAVSPARPLNFDMEAEGGVRPTDRRCKGRRRGHSSRRNDSHTAASPPCSSRQLCELPAQRTSQAPSPAVRALSLAARPPTSNGLQLGSKPNHRSAISPLTLAAACEVAAALAVPAGAPSQHRQDRAARDVAAVAQLSGEGRRRQRRSGAGAPRRTLFQDDTENSAPGRKAACPRTPEHACQGQARPPLSPVHQQGLSQTSGQAGLGQQQRDELWDATEADILFADSSASEDSDALHTPAALPARTALADVTVRGGRSRGGSDAVVTGIALGAG